MRDKKLLKIYFLFFCILLIFVTTAQNVFALFVDNTFGTNGAIDTNVLPSNPLGKKIVAQRDGKILVGGHISNGNYNIWKLSRFTKEGSFDTTFGDHGTVLNDFGSPASINGGIAIQEDNKIVATGSNFSNNIGKIWVGRFSADGITDVTFGVNGFIDITIQDTQRFSVNDILIQNDGKILIAGEKGSIYDSIAFMKRFNSDGTVDTTFGENGTVVVNYPYAPFNRIRKLAVTTDEKIVTYGSLGGTVLGGDPISLYRFNNNGSLDTSFGTDGYVREHFGLIHDWPTDMKIQDDGMIVVTGVTFGDYSVNPSTFVVRYLPDGRRDTSFATNGLYLNMFNSLDNQLNVLALQPDGKILLGGAQSDGNKYNPVLRRLQSDGTIDMSFGDNGSYLIPTDRESQVFSILQSTDGSIVTGLSDEISQWQLKKLESVSLVPTILPTATPTPSIVPSATPIAIPSPTQAPVVDKGVSVDNSKIGNSSTANDKWQYFGAWIHGGYSVSRNSGDYAVLTFTGKKVALYGVRCTSCGKATVSLDGGPEMVIDTYASAADEDALLWMSSSLRTGKHTLTIQILDEKSLESSNSTVFLQEARIIKAANK